MTRPKARIDALELLRFVLAFAVVIYHYYFFAPLHGIIPSSPVRGLGLLLFAVEAFFAVSGFVIVLSTRNRTPAEFLVARLSRLGPTLLIGSTFTFCLYHLLSSEPAQVHATLRYLASIAVIPLLSGLGAFDWSLWSLILELRFYLVIFACMFFIDTTEKSFHIAVAILGYDAVLQLAPVIGLPLPEWLNLFGTHGFGAYGPFFAVGILLYCKYSGAIGRTRFAIAMIAAVLLSSTRAESELARVNTAMLHLGPVKYAQALTVALAIPAIVAAFLRSARSTRVAAALRFLGAASYPLYVIHQLCGYWIINFCAYQLHWTRDIRPTVILGMTLLALYFGNHIEPRLIAAYRAALAGAINIFPKGIGASAPSGV